MATQLATVQAQTTDPQSKRGASRETVAEVMASPRAALVPWPIYWLMPGGLGAYLAEYSTRAEAEAALAEGQRRYNAGERERG